MKRTLERYYALFSANLQEAMVYRFAFFTNFLAEVVKTIVMLEVWMAVYRQRSTVAGFDYSMMVTYLLVSQAVNNVYGFRNDAERPISEKIRKGTIVSPRMWGRPFCRCFLPSLPCLDFGYFSRSFRGRPLSSVG